MKLRVHKVFKKDISSMVEAREALEDCGLNLYNLSPMLRKDRNLVRKAILKDPFAAKYMDKNLKDDIELKRLVDRMNDYCMKFFDPLLPEYSIQDNVITDDDLRKIVLRNERYLEKEEIKRKTFGIEGLGKKEDDRSFTRIR